MKKIRIHIVSFLFGLLAMTACNPQPSAPLLLERAVELAGSKPDSALTYIDSIFYPEQSLSRGQYMLYLLTHVQVRYKTYRDISGDTAVFMARDYFVEQNKNPHKTALACFYTGCVYREQGDYAQAMRHYKDAENYAGQTTDAALQGLVYNNMGDLFRMQGLHTEALKNYRQAEQVYRPFPEKQIAALEAMGLMFALIDEPDSALACCHKAIELAEKLEDRNTQSRLAQSLSITYRETGDLDKALSYLQKALSLNTDTTELPRYYLNFAKLYIRIGKSDSAAFYTGRLKKCMDSVRSNHMKYSAYKYLAEWAKTHSQYDESFVYQSAQMTALEKIMDEQKEQSVYEIHQKYDLEQMQNRHNRILIGRQRQIILLLILGMVITAAAALLLRRVLLQKNRLLKMQEVIQILRRTAKDLQHSQTQSESGEEKAREILLWKFNVQQKALQLSNYMSASGNTNDRKLLKRFEEIVYSANAESQWKMLAETLEELNPGFASFIKDKYPELQDIELKICLLSQAGLRSKDIAMVLNQSSHTIDVKRSRIRKKMNMEKDNNFYSALKELCPQQK